MKNNYYLSRQNKSQLYGTQKERTTAGRKIIFYGYDDVVLDGYCNPIETLSHSFVCKPIYLRLYRRPYKRANTDFHYSNEYDVALRGVKMVPELGIFLKED